MDPFIESLPKLPTSQEMGQWDKAAIQFGIPENLLMENAGRAVFEAIKEKYGSPKSACILMGPGNNGGDAACVARHICDAGGIAAVYCVKDQLSGSPGWHAELAKKDGARFCSLDQPADPALFIKRYINENGSMPDIIIDGLLGTGFKGELRPGLLETIKTINRVSSLLACPVIAIDIPSGLDSDTGLPSPEAIRADLTVTLAAAKPGLLLPWARACTGMLVCRPIGIPKILDNACSAKTRLLMGEALAFAFTPPQNSFKNIFGHVAIFGGCPGYTGAAQIACIAALATGAGLVSACSPSESIPLIKNGFPEIMATAASHGPDWPKTLSQDVLELINKATALVIGPGLGRTGQANGFLRELLSIKKRPPAVIDADALYFLGKDRSLLASLKPEDILTPHPGEAGFLLGRAGQEVQVNRTAALAELNQLTQAVIVLKGAATLVGRQNDPRLLCPYDIPALAIGGAGDALAGCIGALLGSNQYARLDSLGKAGLGILLHAMAGLYLSRSYPNRGILASHLALALSQAKSFSLSQPSPLQGLMPWPQ